MDGFGEIIYIIIMVAIFIFSALRKKKPKGDDMPAPEDRESESPFDEVFSPFKEIFGDDETTSQKQDQQQPQTEPVSVNRKGKKLKDAPFIKEDYVFTARTSPQDARRQRKNQAPGRREKLKTEESKISREEEEAQQNINNWFNLRKAVIHSEILKRPDY
jgi:hypothetical protein